MDFSWMFAQMLLVLVFVCGLAFVALKYVMPRFAMKKQGEWAGQFELLSKFPIDFRRNLYLVRAGKRYLVIGSSEQNLNCLAELKPEDLQNLKS